MPLPTLPGWNIEPLLLPNNDPGDGTYYLTIAHPDGFRPATGTGGKTLAPVVQGSEITIEYQRTFAPALTDQWALGFTKLSFRGEWPVRVVCAIQGGSDTHEESITLVGAGGGGGARVEPKYKVKFVGSMRSSGSLFLLVPGKKP